MDTRTKRKRQTYTDKKEKRGKMPSRFHRKSFYADTQPNMVKDKASP